MVDIPREDVLDLMNSIYPFRRMEPDQVDLIADNLEMISFNEGEHIYEANDPAEKLYIVYRGAVRIYVEVDEEEETLDTHRRGDFFGFEVLESQGFRQSSAVALNDALLLAFTEEKLAFLAEANPDFGESLELMSRSFKLNLRLRFDWMDVDEVIYYLARRHPIFLIIRFIPLALLALAAFAVMSFFFVSAPGAAFPLIGAALLLLVVAFVVAWVVIDYLNDYSIITNRRVVFQERIVLFYDSRVESPLTAIQSVTTETSFLGRQFDYGDVVVKTYTGTIILPDVWDPSHVARIVEADWYRARISRVEEETEMIEHKVAEIVGIEEEQPPEPEEPEELPITPEREVSTLRRLYSNLFAMRFETNGNIIYRKHWWILLKNIWLPTVLLVGLFLLAVYSVIFVGAIISPAAGLALFFVGGLVVGAWWLYQYMDWRNDYFMVTDEQILDVYKKPLAHEERRVAPLRNILSIEFQRLGLIGLILNFGTVYIRVGDTQLTFDEVFNPSAVQRDLFNRLSDRVYKDRIAEIDRDQQRIAQWMATYHRMSHGNNQNPPAG